MSNKKALNLSDFNLDGQDVLYPKKRTGQRKKEEEKLVEKLQVGLTKKELESLQEQYKDSDFPSFSSFVRMRLKKIRFI